MQIEPLKWGERRGLDKRFVRNKENLSRKRKTEVIKNSEKSIL